jgi:ketosteroid isomerase-like protein
MWLFAGLQALPLTITAQTPALRCEPALHNEASVVAANAEFEAAIRESDVTRLARLLAADFLFITASGEMRDRQELLRTYGAKEVHLKAFQSENITVRLHGTVGLLTADITKDGRYSAGPRAGSVFTGRYRFTRVYTCGAHGWQLASSHESQLKG